MRGGSLVIRRSSAAVVVAALAALASAGEQNELIHQHFGAVLLLARRLVIPRPGLDFAFDVKLRALLHVIADDLGSALEGDEIVPFRAVGPVAGGVFGAVGRC